MVCTGSKGFFYSCAQPHTNWELKPSSDGFRVLQLSDWLFQLKYKYTQLGRKYLPIASGRRSLVSSKQPPSTGSFLMSLLFRSVPHHFKFHDCRKLNPPQASLLQPYVLTALLTTYGTYSMCSCHQKQSTSFQNLLISFWFHFLTYANTTILMQVHLFM